MDAGKRQISFYFNGQDYLEIPFFQRSYVWKEDLLKRFLESMEHISVTGKDYFMGSIISKQKPQNSSSKYNVQLIVDGQQRLTTLALFLKCQSCESLLTINNFGIVLESAFVQREK